MEYIRGLLGATGRKTLRNIAQQIGGESARQSVHHFISGSSWDFDEIRRDLALAVARMIQPEAWVVKPAFIPKAGMDSVGVDKQFVPHLGQTITGQQAFGAWLASAEAAVPVNWRLVLSERWLANPDRRRRASIPQEIGVAPLEESASDVVLSAIGDWGMTPHPVILDSEGLHAGECFQRFDRAGVPLVMRIEPTVPVRIDGHMLQGYSDREVPAGQLVDSTKRLRQPVEWQGARVGRDVAAVIPVVLRDPDQGADIPLLLLAHWSFTQRRRLRLWLSSATELPVATALALTELTDAVDRDFTLISENVGIRDFAGRSFQGWHRHVTMASVAHLVALLAGPEHFPATRVAAVPQAM